MCVGIWRSKSMSIFGKRKCTSVPTAEATAENGFDSVSIMKQNSQDWIELISRISMKEGKYTVNNTTWSSSLYHISPQNEDIPKPRPTSLLLSGVNKNVGKSLPISTSHAAQDLPLEFPTTFPPLQEHLNSTFQSSVQLTNYFKHSINNDKYHYEAPRGITAIMPQRSIFQYVPTAPTVQIRALLYMIE